MACLFPHTLTFLPWSASSHCLQQAPIIVPTKVEPLVGEILTFAFFSLPPYIAMLQAFLPPLRYTLLISCVDYTYYLRLSTILSTHGAICKKKGIMHAL
jgi:hypothetical protein